MKKLLILPMLFAIGVATAQDHGMDKKATAPTSSLDGRSFKITLSSTAGTSDVQKNTQDADRSDPYKNDKAATNKGAETMDQAGNTKSDKESMANKTTVLRFENGSVQCSFMSTKNMDNCPYTLNGSKSDVAITFTATCKNTSNSGTKKSCTWNGTVDGKNISGSINMVKDDGQNVSYSFTGTETDGTKDLGLK